MLPRLKQQEGIMDYSIPYSFLQRAIAEPGLLRGAVNAQHTGAEYEMNTARLHRHTISRSHAA